MGLGFGFHFSLFNILFALILGLFVLTIAKGIAEWNRNNHSPCLTVAAEVITKRISTTHHGANHHSSTSYYVTFEFERGDRMEFRISGREYGMLAEGDAGELTFQGTRYLEFERF